MNIIVPDFIKKSSYDTTNKAMKSLVKQLKLRILLKKYSDPLNHLVNMRLTLRRDNAKLKKGSLNDAQLRKSISEASLRTRIELQKFDKNNIKDDLSDIYVTLRQLDITALNKVLSYLQEHHSKDKKYNNILSYLNDMNKNELVKFYFFTKCFKIEYSNNIEKGNYQK